MQIHSRQTTQLRLLEEAEKRQTLIEKHKTVEKQREEYLSGERTEPPEEMPTDRKRTL